VLAGSSHYHLPLDDETGIALVTFVVAQHLLWPPDHLVWSWLRKLVSKGWRMTYRRRQVKVERVSCWLFFASELVVDLKSHVRELVSTTSRRYDGATGWCYRRLIVRDRRDKRKTSSPVQQNIKYNLHITNWHKFKTKNVKQIKHKLDLLKTQTNLS
jgi:hypothetical protein